MSRSGYTEGKGKSFPILKPGDAALKANIIRIAKAKGWTSELPKAWESGDDKAKHLPVRLSPFAWLVIAALGSWLGIGVAVLVWLMFRWTW